MKCEISNSNGIKFIKPKTKKLDLFKRNSFEKNFIFDNYSFKALAIDLSAVFIIDSSILGLFIKYSKELNDKNIELVIFGIPENLTGVFQLTKINYIIPLLNTRQDVIDKFNQ